jgi:hypothetical protein
VRRGGIGHTQLGVCGSFRLGWESLLLGSRYRQLQALNERYHPGPLLFQSRTLQKKMHRRLHPRLEREREREREKEREREREGERETERRDLAKWL